MLAKSFRLANTVVYGGILALVLLYGLILLPKGYFEVPRLKTQDLFFRVAHALDPMPQQIKNTGLYLQTPATSLLPVPLMRMRLQQISPPSPLPMEENSV